MRADRLLAMIMLLQTRGKMTAKDLAAELEVSCRTILRDMEALSMAGIPIYAEGGHGGGIALDEAYRTSLTGLHEAEVLTLFISDHAQRLQDIGLDKAAEASVLKLLAALPTKHQLSVEHVRQRFLIDPDWWWQDAEPPSFWDELQRAVYEDRYIEALYENRQNEISARLLEPYSLVAKSSLWYLVARRDDTFRTYRVSRFHEITVLDRQFQRQDDFDLPSHWQQQKASFSKGFSEYECRLRIPAVATNFLRRLIPGRYQIVDTDGADDWLIVDVQLETKDLAVMLAFGLAPQVEILSPTELRQSVMERAQRLLKDFTT
jgi:predicted DNA-binding transcriptional regulator YafY